MRACIKKLVFHKRFYGNRTHETLEHSKFKENNQWLVWTVVDHDFVCVQTTLLKTS